jgi:type VI protein secretion system component Hcp
MAGRGIEITEYNFSLGKPTMQQKGDLGDILKELKGELTDDAKRAIEGLKSRLDELENNPKVRLLADMAEEEPASLSVSKYVDVSTADLLQAYNDSCSPKNPLFETVMITSYRAGGAQIPYLRAIFGSVRLVSYKLQMSSPLPKEDLEFEFLQCKLEYWPQTSAGGQGEGNKYGWDFNKKAIWRKMMPLATTR